jgi:hypothetical protein
MLDPAVSILVCWFHICCACGKTHKHFDFAQKLILNKCAIAFVDNRY